MIDASVARRYARALLSLALEEGRHEQFGQELDAVLKVLEESKEARAIVRDPGAPAAARQGLIDAIAQGAQLSPVVVNFLRLVSERQRLHDLAGIARAYHELVDRQVGRVRATVTAAAPLNEDDLSRVRDSLARMTGRTIILEARTDPKLIGGVTAQVGATLFDGSLRTQLERMREQLKRGT